MGNTLRFAATMERPMTTNAFSKMRSVRILNSNARTLASVASAAKFAPLYTLRSAAAMERPMKTNACSKQRSVRILNSTSLTMASAAREQKESALTRRRHEEGLPDIAGMLSIFDLEKDDQFVQATAMSHQCSEEEELIAQVVALSIQDGLGEHLVQMDFS